MRAYLLIANARAGSAAQEAVDAVVGTLRADREVDVEIARPAGPDELADAVRGRGGREVVVLGGDGSVHLVVQALHDLGELATTVVGLVPMGTGNDLARAVGLPLEPDPAAQVLRTGRPRTLDLLVDDAGQVVVNAVHVGVGAEAAREAADLKSRLGRLAYPAGAARAGVRTDGWRLRVEVDGAVVSDGTEPVLMAGIGNGTSIGGGTRLFPDAIPDDGFADVVVSRAVGPVARVAYGAALAAGRHVDRDDVVVVRGREVSVAGEAVPVNADGELEDGVAARTWRVLPGAWHLTTS